jgi:hypothetical protein
MQIPTHDEHAIVQRCPQAPFVTVLQHKPHLHSTAQHSRMQVSGKIEGTPAQHDAAQQDISEWSQ